MVEISPSHPTAADFSLLYVNEVIITSVGVLYSPCTCGYIGPKIHISNYLHKKIVKFATNLAQILFGLD